MSNLVPEVRVNKNGVPVVKHVKPDPDSARRMGGIPAPQATVTHPSKRDLLMNHESGVAYEIRKALNGNISRLGEKGTAEMLETLHEETIDVLESIYSKSDLAQYSVNVLMLRCLAQRDFADLNNVMTVADLIKNGSEVGYGCFGAVVGGLQMNRPAGSPLIDWSLRDKSEWIKPQALYKAATDPDFSLYVRQYGDSAGVTRFLKSPSLHNFILERPQDVDRIISILNERQIESRTDEDRTNTLRELLDQKLEGAIAEGVL
jgi:hypothetical protein